MKYALILALVSLFSFACSQNTTELEERIAVLEKKQYETFANINDLQGALDETSKALAELQIAVKEPQPDQPIFSAGEATALVIEHILYEVPLVRNIESWFVGDDPATIFKDRAHRRCQTLQAFITGSDAFDERFSGDGLWIVSKVIRMPRWEHSGSPTLEQVDYLFEWFVYENSMRVAPRHNQNQIPIC